MIIGITGSSGSGKSTVCRIIEENYHVKIINADDVARELSKKGTDYLNCIAQQFGSDILYETGELNRYKLSEIIYNDDIKREELNRCTLPYIVREIKNEIQLSKQETVIIDAPLLFESGLNEICNVVIGIISKKDIQIDRIIRRENITCEQAKKRIKAQQSNDFYIKNCNDIIENDNDFSSIKEKIKNIAKKYKLKEKSQ